MAGFDPYFDWLGIPSREQPPNCYRLLGVDLFEKDPDVIEQAATQRIAGLRSHQTGPNADVAQRVITEVAAARITLLNPARRTEYDTELQSDMLGEKASPSRSEPMEESERPTRRRRPAREEEASDAEREPPRKKRRILDRTLRRRPREEREDDAESDAEGRPPISLPALVGGLIALTAIVVGGLAFLNRGGDDKPESDGTETAQQSPLPQSPSDATPATTVSTGETAADATTANRPTGAPATPVPTLEPVPIAPQIPAASEPAAPASTAAAVRGKFFVGGTGNIELHLNGRLLPRAGSATTETVVQEGDVLVVRVRNAESVYRAFCLAFLTTDQQWLLSYQADDLRHLDQTDPAKVTVDDVLRASVSPGEVQRLDLDARRAWDELRIPSDETQWLWGIARDDWELFGSVVRLDRMKEVIPMAEVPRPPDTPVASGPMGPGLTPDAPLPGAPGFPPPGQPGSFPPDSPPPGHPSGAKPLSFADVEILAETGSLADLRPGVRLRPSAVDVWGGIPAILADCRFSQLTGPTLAFRVRRPGVVLVATTQRWKGGGPLALEEMGAVLDKPDLETLGWRPLTELPTSGGQALTWLVFCRDCREGENLSLRTEKFLAPILICPQRLNADLVSAVRAALEEPATSTTDESLFAELPVVVPGSRPVPYRAPAGVQIPAELVGGTTFEFADAASDSRSGLLVFTAKRLVAAYLIAHWKYEGNNDGNWTPERLSPEQLVAQGWENLGAVPWDSEVFLFRRNLTPGPYRIRTNKFTPPQLILPADASDAGLAAPSVIPPPDAGPLLPAGPQPVPSEDDVYRAEQQLGDILKPGLQAGDAQKLAHAQGLLDRAAQSRGQPAEQFAILQKAMDLAGEAGDSELTLRVIDGIAAEFAIDVFGVKMMVLQNLASKASTAPRIDSFVRAANTVINEALTQQKNVEAYNLARLAYQCGQTPQGAAVRQATQQRLGQVEAILTNDDRLAIIRSALQANPDDPEANKNMGLWLCLFQNDWPAGLPHLVKGPPSEMTAAAQKDLARPQTPLEQAALGDMWWKVSESYRDEDRTELQRRAASWYQEALPQLSGVARSKVEKRLETLSSEFRSRIPKP